MKMEQDDNGTEDDLIASNFGLLDIFRILLGLFIASELVVRVITGKWVTGFKTEVKIQEVANLEKRKLDLYWAANGYSLPYNFRLEELSNFSGNIKDTDKPIVIAINGSVFDVSSSRNLYGPWGPYKKFSGTDCSNNFQYGIFDYEGYSGTLDCDWDISGLDENGMERVRQWYNFFLNKYPLVGYVILPEKN